MQLRLRPAQDEKPIFVIEVGAHHIYDDTGFYHNYRHRSVISMTKKIVRPKMSRMCLFFVVLVHLYNLSLYWVSLQKKYTSMTFWAERIFFCHTYDTSMTVIVTKPGIIIVVVGSYFYDKKS